MGRGCSSATKAFALPLARFPRRNSRVRLPRCVAEYDDRLVSAESAGDAIVALEVLAEVRALFTCCICHSTPYDSHALATKSFKIVPILHW